MANPCESSDDCLEEGTICATMDLDTDEESLDFNAYADPNVQAYFPVSFCVDEIYCKDLVNEETGTAD